MKTKKILTLELDDYRNKVTTYVGRCLGLIDNDKFAEIISDKDEANKFYTQETKSINSVVEKIKDNNHKSLRVAMAVKTKNGKNVKGKALFFTNTSGFYSKKHIVSSDKEEFSFYCLCGKGVTLTETEEPK